MWMELPGVGRAPSISGRGRGETASNCTSGPVPLRPQTRKSPPVPQASLLLQKLQFETHQPGEEEKLKRPACKCPFLPAATSANPDLHRMGRIGQICSGAQHFNWWNFFVELGSRGQGKLEGEQLEAGAARVALCCLARASEGCQSLRHDLLPSLSASGRALPAPSPADRPRAAGRERSGAEGALNEDRSPNRPEAGSGRCEGEGRAATNSEAQQPLQLNQFGDKNSAVLPLQWFHKGLSCVGEKPSRGVSLPPLQTGERSTIATTTRAETPFFFILSLFLYFPVSRSLSPSP